MSSEGFHSCMFSYRACLLLLSLLVGHRIAYMFTHIVRYSEGQLQLVQICFCIGWRGDKHRDIDYIRTMSTRVEAAGDISDAF